MTPPKPSLYNAYLAFRATLNLPEHKTPLTTVTVKSARNERVPRWKGESTDRRRKR